MEPSRRKRSRTSAIPARSHCRSTSACRSTTSTSSSTRSWTARRVYDVSHPHHPKLVNEQKIGSQLNMLSETWAGDRIYFTTSLLANWDKPGKDDEQFLKAYGWDGKKLTPLFTVDFKAEKLGRPHLMRFGQDGFYKNEISESEVPNSARVVESVAAQER